MLILLSIIVGAITYSWLKDIYISQIEQSLKDNINLIAREVITQTNLDKLALYVKKTTKTRLTIINENGLVLAESHKDKTTMDNHRYRKEILESKKKEFGQIIRHSDTLNKDLIYLVKRFPFNNGFIYIRMAKELQEVNEILYSLALRIGIVLLVFFVLMFYMAYKASLNIEQEIKKIMRFLLGLTKKKSNLFISSNFSYEFFEITRLLSKVSRILAKQHKQQAKYASKLKKSNVQKDDIISAISHEFKNPIAVINGYSQTLLDEKDINENIREKFLKKIYNNGEKLSLLIDKLRLSIRLDEKKLSLNLVSLNLNTLVEHIVEDIMQNFKYRNITIKAKETINMKADHILLEVAISNLIENALKYSEDDVEVYITKNSIDIKDSGIGISEYEVAKITQKFYRVSNNTWNNSLGLGLSIVSNIIKLHHFKLDIKSQKQHGSTFSIRFD